MENKETLENKVFTALGEVSMCWSETPTGIFDSVKAKEVGDRLMKEIYEQGNTFVIDTKLVPENMNVEEFLKTFKNQPIQFFNSKPSLKEAIEVLQEHLKEDKSEGSYYHAWQCNIAMAFKDEVSRLDPVTRKWNRELVHTIANQAAKDFLDILITR